METLFCFFVARKLTCTLRIGILEKKVIFQPPRRGKVYVYFGVYDPQVVTKVLYVAGGATQNTIRVAQWMLQVWGPLVV